MSELDEVIRMVRETAVALIAGGTSEYWADLNQNGIDMWFTTDGLVAIQVARLHATFDPTVPSFLDDIATWDTRQLNDQLH